MYCKPCFLCWRCEVDRHAPPGWPGSPGGAGEDRHPERFRGRHVEGPPGLRLHAPRPRTPAGHRCARCGRIPWGENRDLAFWDCPNHIQPDSQDSRQKKKKKTQLWASNIDVSSIIERPSERKWEQNKKRPNCRNKFRLRAGERGSWNVVWTLNTDGFRSRWRILYSYALLITKYRRVLTHWSCSGTAECSAAEGVSMGSALRSSMNINTDLTQSVEAGQTEQMSQIF